MTYAKLGQGGDVGWTVKTLAASLNECYLFNLVMLFKSEYGYVIWGQQKWDTLTYGKKKKHINF